MLPTANSNTGRFWSLIALSYTWLNFHWKLTNSAANTCKAQYHYKQLSFFSPSDLKGHLRRKIFCSVLSQIDKSKDQLHQIWAFYDLPFLRLYRVLQKKCNYFNLLSFAYFLHKKLKMRDIVSQIDWIVSESQRNFLLSTCLIWHPFLLKHAFTCMQKFWPTFCHVSLVTSAA